MNWGLKMDAAERWLMKNDPKYKIEKAKNLRKKREKDQYYSGLKEIPEKAPPRRFPKGDGP